MKNWLIGLLIVGFVSVLGCQAQDKNTSETQTKVQKELKVAVAAPYTGGAAAFGAMIRRGAELKEKEINEAGGINGMKLSLVFEDDAGKDAEASLVAERIASNLQILAVVGHFNSSCSLAGKPIYQRAGIVELSPGSTNVNVCEGSDWTFRNLYRDDFQGKFIAQYIKKHLPEVQSVAVFFDNDDYGRGLRNAFVAEAERIALNLAASEAYDRDNTDFKAQLTSIKAKDPDAIFISGLYSEAGLIVKQARETGITAQFFGADGVDSPDFLKIAGTTAEGAYLTTPFTFGAAGAEAQQMADNFQALHGVAPDTWAALTYDAVGMIADALKKTYNPEAFVADNRKAIRDHLASLDTAEEGYSGVTGLTYFDTNGDTVNKPAYVKIVKDGQFVAAEKQLLEVD